MKKFHYLFTKDGACSALGVTQSTFNKKLRKAEEFGIEICKMMGGIKLFDIDCIEYPEEYIQDEHIPKENNIDVNFKGQLSFDL